MLEKKGTNCHTLISRLSPSIPNFFRRGRAVALRTSTYVEHRTLRTDFLLEVRLVSNLKNH